ncbi:30S ribosomal protein S28e [Candidatus Pacearchaeota archaeon CG10_big_fil_rev_8_21_14_0_10_34_76]|nr:MAG: 30S ribosomal protein S28e [Candidatus Pacearchaeota archaeon CG10_big_fil_rev_8_21_14_0_10_34_76]
MAQKKQKAKEVKSGEIVKGSLTQEPVGAVVEQLYGRTGARGEITQVLAKILGGRNEGKTMRRNVKGPVRIGDLLALRETEIEARRIRKNITKGAHS